MKKYISMLRIRFIHSLQYRAAALAGASTQFFWGLMFILMFSAFYRSNPSASPMEPSQFSSYIWLQQAFLALFFSYFTDTDIFESITNGNVAYELCRPVDIYGIWFVKNAALRLSRALLRCIPIFMVAWFLPVEFRLSPPENFSAALLFLISLALGLFVVIAFSMLIYVSAFYTLSSQGVRLAVYSLTDFLSGAYIPLSFFPDKFRAVVELLPFGSMQNVPLRIYSGNISGIDSIYRICLQLFWVMALVLIGQLTMQRALKRVVVQGG